MIERLLTTLGLSMLAAGVVFSFVSTAAAACQQSDLFGRWQTYAFTADNFGNVVTESCDILLGFDGRLRRAATCVRRFPGSGSDSFSVTNGRFRLSSNCAITGSFGGASIEARLSRDGDVFPGRAHGGSVVSQFTAARW